MKALKYFLLLCSFLISTTIQAQFQESIDSSTIKDEHLSALSLLDKEIDDQARAANVFGGISVVGLVVVGVAGVRLSQAENIYGTWGLIVLGSFVSSISGLKGIYHHKKKKRKIKERDALLGSQEIGYQKEQAQLYLGMTANGVGLSILF